MEKERRLQIIKAADKRFSRHGLGKTTLDEIARDLRIGKATIYHYFISKEELFFETISWEVTQIIEDIKAIFSNDEKEMKEKITEYFSYKESIVNKYKLIYEILLLLLKEEDFEREAKIMKDLFKREEEILTQSLNVYYSGRNKTDGFGTSLFLIMQSWGGLFSNKLTQVFSVKDAEKMKLLLDTEVEHLLL